MTGNDLLETVSLRGGCRWKCCSRQSWAHILYLEGRYKLFYNKVLYIIFNTQKMKFAVELLYKKKYNYYG